MLTAGLHLETGVLEVEVTLDAVHDVVVDLALVAQADDLGALSLEQLANEALVVDGPCVDRAVVLVVEARREPPDAEVVHRTDALRRFLAHPLLADELVDPREGGARREQPRLGLALGEGSVV